MVRQIVYLEVVLIFIDILTTYFTQGDVHDIENPTETDTTGSQVIYCSDGCYNEEEVTKVDGAKTENQVTVSDYFLVRWGLLALILIITCCNISSNCHNGNRYAVLLLLH